MRLVGEVEKSHVKDAFRVCLPEQLEPLEKWVGL